MNRVREFRKHLKAEFDCTSTASKAQQQKTKRAAKKLYEDIKESLSVLNLKGKSIM